MRWKNLASRLKPRDRKTTQTITSYLRSDLRDQQPEILAPVQSSRVISASDNNLLPSNSPVTVATSPKQQDEVLKVCKLQVLFLVCVYAVHSHMCICEASTIICEISPRCCPCGVSSFPPVHLFLCVTGTKRITGNKELLGWY